MNKILNFFRTCRNDGLSRALARAKSYAMSRVSRQLEKRFGLDVEDGTELDSLTIESDHKKEGFSYGASSPRLVKACLASLPIDFASHTFVDIGSGKGLVLLLASRFQFREIIGVEFAKELHETAQANIEKFSCPKRVCGNVRSVWMDAACFEIPTTDSVLYFCNPFTERVMQTIVRSVEQSHAEHGQRITIIFQQLRDEDDTSRADEIVSLLDSVSFLQSRGVRYRSVLDRLLLSHMRIRIYETGSTGGSDADQAH